MKKVVVGVDEVANQSTRKCTPEVENHMRGSLIIAKVLLLNSL